MKLGPFLLVLLIALVGFGFSVRDNMQARSELTVAHKTISTLQDEGNLLRQKLSEQTNQIQVLQSRYDELNYQNQVLLAQNTELKKQNNTIAQDLGRLQNENVRLQKLAVDGGKSSQ